MTLIKRPPLPVEEDVQLVPVRLPKLLADQARAFYKPKQKSVWVCDAVQDLLQRSLFLDANWADLRDDDAQAFVSMLAIPEPHRTNTSHVIRMPSGLYGQVLTAVECITPFFAPEHGRNVLPALIRAAMRQRVLMGGRLLGIDMDRE